MPSVIKKTGGPQTATESQVHFDEIAREYDFWKKKNWYYYANLITLYRSLIPEGKKVLEVGCGTGDVLAALRPSRGKGIDVSVEMIEIARTKYGKNNALTFEQHNIVRGATTFDQDYIFLADVLEHVDNVPEFMAALAKRTKKGASVIISVANPFWEPLLMVAEKFNMKMPEGPHNRISIKLSEEIFRNSGFRLVQRGYRLLVPKKIWGSDWLNRIFYKNRYLTSFGFIVFWRLEK